MSDIVANNGQISLPRQIWALLICSMKEMGYSLTEIESSLGLTRYHVHTLLDEIESLSNDISFKVNNRIKIEFTDDHYAVIKDMYDKNPLVTKEEILTELKRVFPGFDCSLQTLTRHLNAEGYSINNIFIINRYIIRNIKEKND